MKIKQLIEKYQIQLDTVEGVIEKSNSNEDTLTAQAVERFLKGFIKDLKELQSMDVELALKINKLVHNECKDVPHDIGIRIEELVRLHQNELKKCSISDIDSVLAAVISPLTEKGYQILIQPWVDGWLLHLYVKNGSEHLTTIGAPTLQEAVAKGVLYNGVNTVLVNGFVWAVRYSDTDVPDKHGRWARLCYYKGKLICWVSKVVRIDLPTYYKVSDFFPSIQLDNPCYSGVELDKDFETIKKEVEQRFTEFLQAVC